MMHAWSMLPRHSFGPAAAERRCRGGGGGGQYESGVELTETARAAHEEGDSSDTGSVALQRTAARTRHAGT